MCLGLERFAVVDDGDGIVERIKVHAVLPDDDHIHVRLQNGARRVLVPGGTGLIDDDVAFLVAHGGETLFHGPVVEKPADLLLVMGLVRDGAERKKVFNDLFVHDYIPFHISKHRSRPRASR